VSATAQILRRKFTFGVRNLPDPGAQMSPEDVKALYASHYPELLTATVQGPEVKGAEAHYTFERSYGTKGRAPASVAAQDTALAVVERALATGQSASLFPTQMLLGRDQLVRRQLLSSLTHGDDSLRWPGPCAPMPF
jgi:PRTRC genetic system protein C